MIIFRICAAYLKPLLNENQFVGYKNPAEKPLAKTICPVLPHLQCGSREYQHLQCENTIRVCYGTIALQPNGGVVRLSPNLEFGRREYSVVFICKRRTTATQSKQPNWSTNTKGRWRPKPRASRKRISRLHFPVPATKSGYSWGERKETGRIWAKCPTTGWDGN